MGNHCSAALQPAALAAQGALEPCGKSQKPKTGGVLDELGCFDEGCHLCDDDDSPPGLQNTEHPLLRGTLAGTSSDSPRTPRGPTPPWASSEMLKAPIDRTATGLTPPRSPIAPRMTPPGLPDEEVPPSIPPSLSLVDTFDSKFVKDFYAAVRAGNVQTVNTLVHQVNSAAVAKICKAPGTDASSSADRADRAHELVSVFLTQMREESVRGRSCADSLISVACGSRHLEVIRCLMVAKADPSPVPEESMTALHRAAQSGSILSVFMVLDRFQANHRAITMADLTNSEGETPETCACSAGAADVMILFEVFRDMQADAELHQLGSAVGVGPAMEGGFRGGLGTGDMLSYIDMVSEAKSPAGLAATALLRRCAFGNRFARKLYKRIPENEAQLKTLVDEVCEGLKSAETVLLRTVWDPADPSVDPAVRPFVTTARLRSNWQKMRTEAVRLDTNGTLGALDDYWQTHLNAESMTSTIRNAMGDTFQLLLTILWLYTREAWLRHILDALASTVHAVSSVQPFGQSDVDGTTGAAPAWNVDLPSALRVVEPLLDALAPLIEMVQSSLCWFEDAGIRHSAVTFRPLQLPMLGMQRLLDKYVAARRGTDQDKSDVAGNGPEAGLGSAKSICISLGGGSFFSSMSSRTQAVRRLTRTKCNVLLCIRPDEEVPCYPKHMMLRGTNVEDVLFQLDVIFRITRITRTVSSDIDPEACGRSGAQSRWPVMIIEVTSTSRFLEVVDHLEKRGDFTPGELEAQIEEWAAGSAPREQYGKLSRGAEFLARVGGRSLSQADPSTFYTSGLMCSKGIDVKSLSALNKAMQLYSRAAKVAEAAADAEGIARALLAQARCGAPDKTDLGRKALQLLEESLGPNHPQTSSSRVAWNALGVMTTPSAGR